MTGQQLRQIALRQIENRCNRLIKLIKLGAPNAIICREVKLTQKPIALLEEEFIETYREKAIAKIGKAKNGANLCSKKGCLNEIIIDDDKCFGEYLCEVHNKDEQLWLESIDHSI